MDYELVSNGYQMIQIQMKLTDEERIDTIYPPVCQNATAIADTLMKGHAEWKVERNSLTIANL